MFDDEKSLCVTMSQQLLWNFFKKLNKDEEIKI